MLIITIFILSEIFSVLGKNPVVSFQNGKVEGRYHSPPSISPLDYYAFLGIPFAAPPIGILRFQPPQPVKNWTGILQATSNSAMCYQVGVLKKHASENCLFLNVYTPVEPSSNKNLPVLVFIYGGTFRRGHAFNGYKEPAFLMKEDIVVVTFNYRVGPFGFLSTEDSVIPGNMGLKDQQFALKWVQQNIRHFGGDPQKVTLMGQSAGSASVTYQLLSPGSSGLFRAAIGNSGSALCTWAQQRNAADIAYGIAQEINPGFGRNKTTGEILNFLQSVTASAIEKTADKYSVFAPVIEVPHDGAIISEVMYNSVEDGKFNKVPVLMGFNSEEALFKAEDMKEFKKEVKTWDEDISVLVDNITDKDEKLIIGKEIKNIYIANNSLFVNNPGKAIQYFGDNRFIRPIIKFGELLSKHVQLYFYQFSYHGKLGANTVSVPGIGKVVHAEDQNYFWAIHDSYQSFPESDRITSQRYIKLLSNFIKYLNPTPTPNELFENVMWPTATSNNFSYMDIDNDLKINKNPRSFSYEKWVDIFEKHVNKPFISY